MKSNTAIFLFGIITNVLLVIVTGFACWYFKSPWFLLIMLLMTRIELVKQRTDGGKDDKE